MWISIEEAADLVKDESTLALGGAHRMAPVALVAAVAKRGLTGLRLITTPTGGFAAELLLASGAVSAIESAQVSLGELGLAPAFRKGAESGDLNVLDTS